MPHHRKKYTPQKKEQKKAPNTFFQSNQKETAILLPRNKNITKQQNLSTIKSATQHLLKKLKQNLQNTQPEQAQLNQSKALELANQLLAADIYQIQYIQQAVDKICTTLQESHYTDGLCIQRQYGKTKRSIQLSKNWQQLPIQQQVYTLLEQTIKASKLPPLPNPAVGTYTDSPSSEKWAKYVVELIQLLPQQPLLITGTPTSWNPLIQQEEEDEKEEEEMPTEDTNDSEGIGSFLRNLFRKK